MPEEAGEKLPTTPDRLEEAIQEAKDIGLAVAMRGGPGGPLNTFLGTEELRNMGSHLLEHMRDEEMWGESNKSFEPVEFVIAAQEVANDHMGDKTKRTNAHVGERQSLKLTYAIFVDFWLPRIAQVAYGDEFASEVRTILQSTR